MRIYTAESVTGGHPDKLADKIADALVDRYITQDPQALASLNVKLVQYGNLEELVSIIKNERS